MSYAPTWTQADGSGNLIAGGPFIRAIDAAEIADGVNRRRRLIYQGEQDFSPATAAGVPVGKGVINSDFAPPWTNWRYQFEATLLAPAVQVYPAGVGGYPATPDAMAWLWPLADADENKKIVSGFSGVGAGEVGLFAKINGGSDWTDPGLGVGDKPVRAVHFNEMRRAVEYLRRGRWTLPIYGAGGLFSLLPDFPWLTDSLYNDGTDEIRCVGFAIVQTGDSPPLGLSNLTVRTSTCLRLTADSACQIAAYRCKRAIDFADDPPTWNDYAPLTAGAWATAGGLGGADAEHLGTVTCSAAAPADITGAAVAAAVQAMLAGQPQNFTFRRVDTDATVTIALTAKLIVEFDLDSPPN